MPDTAAALKTGKALVKKTRNRQPINSRHPGFDTGVEILFATARLSADRLLSRGREV